MNISGAIVGIAGENFVLTCTMTVVDNLVANATQTISWSGGSVGSVMESKATHSGNVTMRTLTFSSLNTSDGAEYTCLAEISVSSINVTRTGSETRAVIVQSKSLHLCPASPYSVSLCLSPSVPRPVVMVSATESEVVSGSALSLTCSIQPSSVDTPTTLMSNWTAPNNVYNKVNTVNATSVELMISSVETADSGDYICSVRVTDSSGSEYVVDSEPATHSVNIVVSKCYWRSLME